MCAVCDNESGDKLKKNGLSLQPKNLEKLTGCVEFMTYINRLTNTFNSVAIYGQSISGKLEASNNMKTLMAKKYDLSKCLSNSATKSKDLVDRILQVKKDKKADDGKSKTTTTSNNKFSLGPNGLDIKFDPNTKGKNKKEVNSAWNGYLKMNMLKAKDAKFSVPFSQECMKSPQVSTFIGNLLFRNSKKVREFKPFKPFYQTLSLLYKEGANIESLNSVNKYYGKKMRFNFFSWQ
jgi:hypothetical protein